MIARFSPLALLVCANLAACSPEPDRQAEPTGPSTDGPATPSATAEAAPSPTTGVPDRSGPALTPQAEKGEKGARNVLLEWARAVEGGDYARAAAQWGEQGGFSAADHAARFAALGKTTVSFGEGLVEGAAGSLYYEVPVTIAGQGTTLQGRIVLRRVNDVDGASAAQLRWHVSQLELQP